MLKTVKSFRIELIVIGVLALIIVALVISLAVLARRNNTLSQELNITREYIYEMLLAYTALEDENQNIRNELRELQNEFEELWAEHLPDPMHYRAIQHILDIAPERLRYVFDEDVTLNDPEDFVTLPNNRILISGQWVDAHFETTHTLEAIFGYHEQNDDIWISLRSYSPFGWDDWRYPWESPNQHSWVRYHELDVVPVRFYGMGGNWDDTWYNVEYLNGENFLEELAYHALSHLNRLIIDAWFVDSILYVNLHHSEPMRMSSGTFGEWAMYSTLVQSMSSVPDIDALVIMVDGQREVMIGGHGLPFRDIYLIN
ncbi:MAG: GerMN domain-containing protein [Defluviitaleaceae bacterium]|nr:GerMN domain-containing protein [Defluviitaleaceae bacterium]